MSFTGEDNREMRMQGSLPYNHHPPESPIIPPERARTSDPNSGGGSKPKPKPAPNPRTNYRECLKNHAANMGGNITDGCGEFMPSGEDGTLEALQCAACTCHRNFHRKETPPTISLANAHPLQLPPPLLSPSMSQHRVTGPTHWSPMIQPVKMAMGSGGSVGTDSSSEELNLGTYSAIAPPPPQFSGKKRFRTKFTTEQKDKMMAFAEKLGWRIPREDDTEIQRFCAEVGVKRQVFKVWMHNNKCNSSASKNNINNNNPQEFN